RMPRWTSDRNSVRTCFGATVAGSSIDFPAPSHGAGGSRFVLRFNDEDGRCAAPLSQYPVGRRSPSTRSPVPQGRWQIAGDAVQRRTGQRRQMTATEQGDRSRADRSGRTTGARLVFFVATLVLVAFAATGALSLTDAAIGVAVTALAAMLGGAARPRLPSA